jgi:hypothetical protein
MSDNHDDFLKWAEKHDSPEGRRYWLIAKIVVGLIIACVIALIVFGMWLDGSF